ncbi:uncharacterized protein G2W53_028711 [Senna tora]|uniref:Uncharacterized protein n=1 Tax=Senna tora TaxID=362788 RepID=A0A834T6E6_9FABA|nr:uncharacterized protein G2W53_028711 [Senna tora]
MACKGDCLIGYSKRNYKGV